MDFILQYLPWFWFCLAVLFTIIEFFTFGLATIWFALGALLMMLLSPLPIPFVWQVLIFLVISSLLLIFTRPVAIKKLKVGRERTNTDSLIGARTLVVKEITEFEKGLVRINGVEWSAQSIDNKTIERDATCIVRAIEGVTLVVEKLPSEDN